MPSQSSRPAKVTRLEVEEARLYLSRYAKELESYQSPCVVNSRNANAERNFWSDVLSKSIHIVLKDSRG